MSEQTAPETFAEIRELFKETDAKFRETDAKFKETDALITKMTRENNDRWRRLEGMFGIQWGRMLEALVKPAALQLFRERGIEVHHTYQRLESRINGHTMELDIVLESKEDAVAIEVKSVVRTEDADDLLQDLADIVPVFARFCGRRVYGGIAGLEFAEGADRYAYRQGLFVLGLTGEGMVSIKNDAKFRPRDFGKTPPEGEE